jgi:hypothetical protein
VNPTYDFQGQVAALIERTVAAFGRLDMAFNNAGIVGYTGDLADESAASCDAVTAVNLRGVWNCMKHELLQMRAQGSGAIVNCSSLGGLVGQAGRASYHAANPTRGDEGVHARPADRPARPRRRDRRGDAVALQPRRQLHPRRCAAGRRWLRCALTLRC